MKITLTIEEAQTLLAQTLNKTDPTICAGTVVNQIVIEMPQRDFNLDDIYATLCANNPNTSQKIIAIRLYRELNRGTSLSEAKNYVENCLANRQSPF